MNIKVNVPSGVTGIKGLSLGGITSSQAKNIIKDMLLNNYTNLLNPIHINSTSFQVTGLEVGKSYCCNLANFNTLFAVDNGETVDIDYVLTDGGVYISNIEYDNFVVAYPETTDTSQIMVVEGDTLPEHFKPYGITEYINDNLLQSVYSEIDKQNIKTAVLSSPSSDIYLKSNYIYSLTAANQIAFVLPVFAKMGDQILVQAKIPNEETVINWGTSYFFNKEIPYVGEGNYNFIFEYDNGAWYAGVVPKGTGDEA